MRKALTTPDIALGNCESTTGAGLVFSHPVVKELMDRLGLCVTCDQEQRLFTLHRKRGAPLNTSAGTEQFITLCRRMLRRELCRERAVAEDSISLAEVDHLCRAMAGYESVSADPIVE